MRNFLVVAMLLCAFVVGASAQSEFIRETDNYKMGVGPIIGYKMGVNASDVQDGTKNGVAPATMPDFGAQFYMPLDPDNKMGLIIDAIYANYPFMLKTPNENHYNYNFIGLGANFFLSGFTVGFNLGLPLGGTYTVNNIEGKDDASMLNTMFEFRVGGNFTLNESNTGRFVLFINLGYQINGLYSDMTQLGQGPYNPHPASIQLGLGYLINMGGE